MKTDTSKSKNDVKYGKETQNVHRDTELDTNYNKQRHKMSRDRKQRIKMLHKLKMRKIQQIQQHKK